MAHNNGIITTTGSGISIIADISEVLNVASGDDGVLCRSDNVNMWAKYKPIKYASWVDNGGGEVDSDGNPYGIYRPSHDDIEIAVDGPIYWVKPTGGAASPYRVLDFNGYNHNCECPWVLEMPPINLPKWTQTTGMVIKFLNKGQALPTNNVSISDLYGGLYFCVEVGGYFKTLDFENGESTLSLSDCPPYMAAGVGQKLTFRCAMSSEEYTTWQSGGIDSMFYGIGTFDSQAVRECTIYQPAETVYSFVFNGLTTRIQWTGTGVITNDTLVRDAKFRDKPSSSVEITGAYIEAKLHSSQTVVDTYSISDVLFDCQPYEILKPEWEAGDDVTFSAYASGLGYWVSHLPTASYGDYYEINAVFTYTNI